MSPRAYMGADTPPPTQSPFAPLVSSVGVPLTWMAIGYLLAVLTRKQKAA